MSVIEAVIVDGLPFEYLPARFTSEGFLPERSPIPNFWEQARSILMMEEELC